MTILVLSVLITLMISFLCSLMEATLLSLTPAQVADMSRRSPRLGRLWTGFKNSIEQPIATILILNTAAHTIGATVAGAKFDHEFGESYIWIFSLGFTFLMLQFTEILPKTIGVRFNTRVARVIGGPLRTATALLTPLLTMVHWVNRPFAGRLESGTPRSTVEEITALAGLARLSNQIGAHQERIIKGAARLSRLQIDRVMIPIHQVCFIAAEYSLPEAIAAAHLDAHTRFPVFENKDPDRVIGYVNFKEMIYVLRTNPNDATLRGVTRPITFCRADASASEVLRLFVDQRVHMAVIQDESGRNIGLVTLEDLVEELVGELDDEFDRLPHMLHSLRGGAWMVGGGVPITELEKRIGCRIDHETSETTIADWLTARLGSPPRAGQSASAGGMEFVARRIRRGRIFEIAVRPAIADDRSGT